MKDQRRIGEDTWISYNPNSDSVTATKVFPIKDRACLHIKVFFTDPVTGKKKGLKKSTRVRRDAPDAYAKACVARLRILSEYQTNHDPSAPATFNRFKENYIKERTSENLSPSSIRGITAALNTLGEFIGVNRPLSTIKVRDVRNFLFREELTGSVALAHYRYLHTAFEHALRDERVTFNPCKQIDLKALRRRYKPRPRGLLTPEDVLSIYGMLPQVTFVDRTFANYFLLLFGTALRRGEACYLKWADIDLKSLVIHVRSSDEHTLKTEASEADLPFTYITETAIAQQFVNVLNHPHEKVKNSEYVFCNSKGDHYHPDSLSKQVIKRVKTICRTLGISTEGVDLHSLRHSVIQELVDSGSTAAIVSKFARHASLSTTLGAYHKTKDTQTKFESVIKTINAIPIPC